MKKVNTKTSKKIVAVILATVAAFSVMGCSVEKNFTKTETHTVVDADGNKTTTTTTNHNGVVTTETTTTTAEEAMSSMETEDMEVEEINDVAAYENVPMAFTNNMGWDVAEFYIKMSDQDEWSENFLSEDQYIDNGVTADGANINYSEEQRFVDICLVDSEGTVEEFDAVELPADGANQIEVVFEYDEVNNVFTATVYAE